MIKCLHRGRTNREGEGDEKCNSAFSPCTRLVPSIAEGHAALGSVSQSCEHYLVLANLVTD